MANPQAQKAIVPEMDKNKLLLLGLNLLNKGLKLPCAVVHPQLKHPSDTTEVEHMEETLKQPVSAQQNVHEESSRKRKRNVSDDTSEIKKREKRKMMNRVSAQNARDRKKAYIEDLERKVSLLEEKNKKLEEENATLKKHTSTLSQEKEQLEHKLVQTTETNSLQSLLKETLLQEPLTQGSAAPSVVSLQQKHFLKKLFLLRVILTFNLSYWPPSLKCNLQPNLQQQLDQLENFGKSFAPALLSNNFPLLRESPWWGTNNSKWNPPKN